MSRSRDLSNFGSTTADVTDLNYAKTLYDTGVTGAEFDQLDTTSGTPGSGNFLRGDKTWASAGGVTLLDTGTFSGVSVVELGTSALSTDYRIHKLYMYVAADESTSGLNLLAQIYTGGAWLAEDYSHVRVPRSACSACTEGSNNQNYMSYYEAADVRISGNGIREDSYTHLEITMANFTQSTGADYKQFQWEIAGNNHDSATQLEWASGACSIGVTTAITNFKITSSSQDFRGGWECYGFIN